jgi:D-alanyl-D-alanine dipeptidase
MAVTLLHTLALTLALAQPPADPRATAAPDLVDLAALDPSLRLDIRYATPNNFLGRPVYDQPRAFLQRPAAEALLRAHHWLKTKGYGIVVFDGYRPWSVTKIFWDATPEDKKQFVADPAKGSRHNRGCAVDVSMYEIRSGRLVTMPSEYDEMTERAHPDYRGGSRRARRLRDLLRRAMEREGFTVYENEWWHFDYKDCPRYPVLDIPFGAIPRR